MKRKIVISFALVSVMLFALVLTGCDSFVSKSKPKEYIVDNISITIPENFKKMKASELAGFTDGYSTFNTSVFFLKESFSVISSKDFDSENATLAEYAELVIAANKIKSELKDEDGIVYFTYTSTVESVEYSYYATVAKTDKAFWLIQFACASSKFDSNKAQFADWAKTIKEVKS